MKVLQPVPVRVLRQPDHPFVDPGLVRPSSEPRHRALALFTSDSDDVSYIAIDEATKKAAVDVVCASSLLWRAAHASGPYSGEFIGILLSRETPGECRRGAAHRRGLRPEPRFVPDGRSRREADLLSHLVSSCGTYVAEQAGFRRARWHGSLRRRWRLRSVWMRR